MSFYRRLPSTFPRGWEDLGDYVLYGSPAFRCVFSVGRLQLYVTKLPRRWYLAFFDLRWNRLYRGIYRSWPSNRPRPQLELS